MRKRCLILAVLGLVAVFGGRGLLLAASAGTADAAEPSGVPALEKGQERAAIVFGAGLNADGQPSALLRDRVRAAETLLRRRQVDLLLMTGANPTEDYNEPSAMRRLAMADGIPADRIAVDYGGRRSWDSCKRARAVFGIERGIVVSNDFHRARIVVLCRSAGITVDGAVGTPTGRYPLRKRASWNGRELMASWRGAVDAWIRQPSVPVGGPPIDPYDPCAVQRSLSPQDRAATPRSPAGC
ncbi:MAG: YdcF family protein [Solirubrobacteraceae bacterium]|nr:YdcF family protein [Solirubrobacteraceae bacterium]